MIHLSTLRHSTNNINIHTKCPVTAHSWLNHSMTQKPCHETKVHWLWVSPPTCYQILLRGLDGCVLLKSPIFQFSVDTVQRQGTTGSSLLNGWWLARLGREGGLGCQAKLQNVRLNTLLDYALDISIGSRIVSSYVLWQDAMLSIKYIFLV